MRPQKNLQTPNTAEVTTPVVVAVVVMVELAVVVLIAIVIITVIPVGKMSLNINILALNSLVEFHRCTPLEGYRVHSQDQVDPSL